MRKKTTMKYSVKLKDLTFSISTSVANTIFKNNTNFQSDIQGKEHIITMEDSCFFDFKPIPTVSLTHYYISILSSKNLRVKKSLHDFLRLHAIENGAIMNRRNIMSKRFISVCSGAGGLCKGFIDSNFEPLLLNDNDEQCLETIKLNHPNVDTHFGDMKRINLEKYRDADLDVLISGLPCQPFSQIGRRNGIKDPRGQLIFHFIKMVNTLKPKVFVIENVTGMITIDKGETLKLIIKKFENLNYKVYSKVLNANDYNVPQNRKRLFIIGVKNTITKAFGFPGEHAYKPVLRDVLLDCRESSGRLYNKKTYELFTTIPEGGC